METRKQPQTKYLFPKTLTRGIHMSGKKLEYRVKDLVKLMYDSTTNEYYFKVNDAILTRLGLDFIERDIKVGIYDGEAGLYIELRDINSDVVLIEYYDSFMYMGKLARFKDIEDLVIVRHDGERYVVDTESIKEIADLIVEEPPK